VFVKGGFDSGSRVSADNCVMYVNRTKCIYCYPYVILKAG